MSGIFSRALCWDVNTFWQDSIELSPTSCIEQSAEGFRQQQFWTAGPRKRLHDNWCCGNPAHALHEYESTVWTGCGVLGKRSPERFLTFDASNGRVQHSFGGRAASQYAFRRGSSPRCSHQTLKCNGRFSFSVRTFHRVDTVCARKGQVIQCSSRFLRSSRKVWSLMARRERETAIMKTGLRFP